MAARRWACSIKVVFTPTEEVHLWADGERKMDEDAAWVIDAKKDPAALDLNPKKQGEKKELAILKIEGDVLTVCVVEGRRRTAPDRVQVPRRFEGRPAAIQTGAEVRRGTRAEVGPHRHEIVKSRPTPQAPKRLLVLRAATYQVSTCARA